MNKKDDKIIDITSDVKWIGILDYDIRTFDIVMSTRFGSTYNSYFINAEKKALVDISKLKFNDIYLNKLKSETDPSDISYIIVNHTEPDHSGNLKLLLELAPSAVVVGSGNAIRYLEDMVNVPFKSLVVKDGDTLDLGNKTLRFFSTPNLHWPDTIFTWLEEDKILFTCDSFGAHYCHSEMNDDLTDDYLETVKYYFDVILKPYSRFMIKALEKIKPLDIRYICPGHGPILNKNRKKILELTEKWANEYLKITNTDARRHILIAYVSAYGYTKMAAEIIASAIRETADFTIDVVDVENIGLEELEVKLVSNDAILVGSPTINQNTLLPIYKLFAIINPLRDRGKLAGAFGSYGWSGEAPKIILDTFKNLKLKVFEETPDFKFLPEGSKIEILKDFGKKFALRFEEECAQK